MPDFRPFCVKCSTRMRCKKNEVSLVHKNDYIQSGDLYECPQCHCQVICGFGQPILAIGEAKSFVEQLSHGEKEWVYFDRTHDQDYDDGGNPPWAAGITKPSKS